MKIWVMMNRIIKLPAYLSIILQSSNLLYMHQNRNICIKICCNVSLLNKNFTVQIYWQMKIWVMINRIIKLLAYLSITLQSSNYRNIFQELMIE